jgi:hypothetical protein
LDEVGDVRIGTEHPCHDPLDVRAVAVKEPPAGVPITGAQRLDQRAIVLDRKPQDCARAFAFGEIGRCGAVAGQNGALLRGNLL